MKTSAPTPRKAIGIVRVSQVAGREGDSFASPAEQRKRIETECERLELELVDVIEELDVSGGAPLESRKGLRRAVEAVESSEVGTIVAAYFDRLVRSLRVQDELVSRTERAGGQVRAVDVGQVTNGSAGQWLSGTMLGAVSEYQRRTTRERTGEAQAAAIARGVPPWPGVTPGYSRENGGPFVVNPVERPIVVEAFERRAGGAPITKVRDYLRDHGIELSFGGVQRLLASRVVLGELRFGELSNPDAHEPIIARDLWNRVQRMSVPRGRKPKSDRILARLGVLRCGSCGARMGVGSANSGRLATYNCPRTGRCEHRVAISAQKVERIVEDAVREYLADVEGRASAEANIREAELALERAQRDLDSAIRTLAGVADEPAAIERLAELRAARDEAQEHVDQSGAARAAVTVRAATDWERLTLAERRDLIRATVSSVTVAPGRGPDRVTVELLGE